MGGLLKVSVLDSRELQAVIVGVQRSDRDTRQRIRQETRSIIGSAWTQTVAQHARSRVDVRVLSDTARVKVSDQNVTLTSATVGRKLRGGLAPKERYGAIEFGSGDRDTFRRTYTATSKKGNTFKVTRHTRRQLPPPVRAGRVVYPAVAEIVPRALALWTQTVVRGLADALEGKS